MQDVFRDCLSKLDVATARDAWSAQFPQYPPLGSDDDVLTVLHYARTQAESSPLRDRAYSHRWLTDRNYPSGLPDHLRSSAERMYPVVVKAVGVAYKDGSPLDLAVCGAMNRVIEEFHADGGDLESPVLRELMLKARSRVLEDAGFPVDDN